MASPLGFLRGTLFFLLGRILAKSGNPSIAAVCFREAAVFRPAARSALFQQACALWDNRDFDKAREAIDALLQVAPDHPEANNLLGALLLNDHRPREALVYIDRALATRPDFAAAHNNTGNVHLAELDLGKAESAYRRALQYRPDYVEALTNLGETLNRLGNYEAAEKYCRRAAELDPGYAGAYCNLGNVLLNQAHLGEAVAAYREAIRLQPDMAAAHINLAIALGEPAHLVGAIEYYEGMLKRDDNDYLPYLRIGQGLQALGRFEEAEQRFLAANELRGQAPDVLSLLGNNRIHQGDAAGAIDYFRRVLAIGPHPGAQECIAFTGLYLDDFSGSQLLEETRRWAMLSTSRLPHMKCHVREVARSEAKLRIGYVSRDFGFHSVSFFLEPVLRFHRRNSYEVFCYANVISPDAVTVRLKTLADTWRDIAMISDQKAAQLISDDQIDILVDLSGHTSGNRLGIFQLQPAPLQITYLGHPGTSGLDMISYRISDAIADPPGQTEHHYTEAIWRLPRGFLTYSPLENAPKVAPPPFQAQGFITFGSFNNAVKIGPEALRRWADVLHRVPGSRLLLKSHCFSSERGRSRVADLLASHGVSLDRFDLISWLPDCASHLEAYARIDVALDTFPYNGTTTTCEALWMGVPVITYAGDRHSARVGASVLTSVGLSELIAKDADEYVGLAVELATDHERLAAYRSQLRERMMNSHLLDAPGFVCDLETALRDMWRKHCHQLTEFESGAATDPVATPPDGVLRLHIGGQEIHPGWKVLNIQPGSAVDFIGDIRDLSQFENRACDEIYASHVLEHVAQNQVAGTLQGVFRVLKPGGCLRLSVPDLDSLCRLYIEHSDKPEVRLHVMRMIFGGQTDLHDYHQVGFDFEFLRVHLLSAGFERIDRVTDFNIFADTSRYAPYGVPISLNVIAYRPFEAKSKCNAS